MKSTATLLAAACLVCATGAHADEAGFLRSLQGKFAGKGTVRIRTNTPVMNINCTFTSDATANSLSLDGTCRALLIMSREIRADLKVDGESYTGTYIGSRSGPAGLSGSRKGDAINLDIHWAKIVNGDRDAELTVEKIDGDDMRMTVTDMDPATGKMVVTSQIDLKRAK
ncbi:hypothetical protein EN828_17125 [Mesorhizobium sp. M2D.F.Ca.ET.185.01.1.1]|uniref:hypothetical protein n=1 Tax=unclassified Mesorhizobium TaxID=325217 RepID=UPI000FCA2EE1|nr:MULTISPECIES: hypothetical protein [unclassified Mesorhizobium]TGP79173.1 hypothetical protein EN870_13445 [bacterium M00.F.Ca.ET.227.01.1.1]TGQ01089.1 hypothetical protein EN864_03795 [bacterium M00.F.Ca.ET.221.01.1.1]TGQ02393.1 hypothetical protein EN865_00110 [bacterium M00.F.Ca.ET.222.01.1.1]TGT75639.1 hypothetical protein EN802_05210 [bacterium M00.F.Ca.ET.159.01.1.1]TGT81491.1 hypothetical protein EN800_21740 [bacterium M00.F.Ca.ET.157.01.1.1]TGU12290.1 hypothetical protein EN806_178